jgi:hypothetical protein
MKKLSPTIICLALTAITLAATAWNIATHTSPADAQTFGSSSSAINGIGFKKGTADPTAGAGVACTAPCKYFRTGTLEEYTKSGSAATAWSKVAWSGGTIASLTATGTIQGAIVRGTTALEYPDSAAGPGVRCTTDTDTGFGHNGANANGIWSNGTEQFFVTSGQTFVNSAETVIAQELETRDIRVRLPQTVDIDNAADTFSVIAGNRPVQEFTLSAGNITITAAPTLANGANGQEMTLCNVDATDTLTLNDEATTAGSNLQLAAATLALGPRDCVTLRYATAWGDWVQVGHINVA